MGMNRMQFRQHWENILPGLGEESSELWVPEQSTGKKSRYFVKVRPIICENFWKWCIENCRGQILCYSSNDREEWWGFSHKADIMWFVLRWS